MSYKQIFFSIAFFEMRTFRFNTGGSSTEAQQQTVICSLHLDHVNDLIQQQANDCSCYTQTECEQNQNLRGMNPQTLIKAVFNTISGPYLLIQATGYGWPGRGSAFRVFDPAGECLFLKSKVSSKLRWLC